MVLLDYIINFGLSVTDGFNTYTRDQAGRVLSNSSLSKNGPLYDLSKELYVNNLKLNYMMLLELWQITKVVGNDKLQHTVQQSSLSRFYHHFFFCKWWKKKPSEKWGICLRAERVITLFSQNLAQNAVGNHLPWYDLSVALAVPDLHVTLSSRCVSGYNRRENASHCQKDSTHIEKDEYQ